MTLTFAALTAVGGCKTVDNAVSGVTNSDPTTPKPAPVQVAVERCTSPIARINFEAQTNFVGMRNMSQYAKNMDSKIAEEVVRRTNCFILVRAQEEYAIDLKIVPHKKTYGGEGMALGTVGIIAAPITMGLSTLMAIGVAPALAGASLAQMDVNINVEIVRQSDGHYANLEHKSPSDDFYHSEFFFSSGEDARWERSEDGKRIMTALVPAVNKIVTWVRDDKGMSMVQRGGAADERLRHNELVRSIQRLLAEHGHSIAIDGHYGPKTKAAILSYQEKHGLLADGAATSELLAHLNSSN